MGKSNLLISENSLVIASCIKKQNKGIELCLDLAILLVNLLWTFYSYINTSQIMKVFSMVNIGAQVLGNGLVHFAFFNSLRQNKQSNRLRIFGKMMVVLYSLSFILLFLFVSFGSNWKFIDISSLINSVVGWLILIGGVIFAVTEILDKIMYSVAAGMIEKEVQDND